MFAAIAAGAAAVAELAEVHLFLKKNHKPPWRTRKDLRDGTREEYSEFRWWLSTFGTRLVVAAGGTTLFGVADVVVNSQGAVFAGISASVIFTRVFGIPNLPTGLPAEFGSSGQHQQSSVQPSQHDPALEGEPTA